MAGSNDIELPRRTGVGRDVNRHYYTQEELRTELTRPVVRSLLALLRLRNTHPAFQGSFQMPASAAEQMVLEWSNRGDTARLEVDLTEMRATVTLTGPFAAQQGVHVWNATLEA